MEENKKKTMLVRQRCLWPLPHSWKSPKMVDGEVKIYCEVCGVELREKIEVEVN